jgi:hypothetical protein
LTRRSFQNAFVSYQATIFTGPASRVLCDAAGQHMKHFQLAAAGGGASGSAAVEEKLIAKET